MFKMYMKLLYLLTFYETKPLIYTHTEEICMSLDFLFKYVCEAKAEWEINGERDCNLNSMLCTCQLWPMLDPSALWILDMYRLLYKTKLKKSEGRKR